MWTNLLNPCRFTFSHSISLMTLKSVGNSHSSLLTDFLKQRRERAFHNYRDEETSPASAFDPHSQNCSITYCSIETVKNVFITYRGTSKAQSSGIKGYDPFVIQRSVDNTKKGIFLYLGFHCSIVVELSNNYIAAWATMTCGQRWWNHHESAAWVLNAAMTPPYLDRSRLLKFEEEQVNINWPKLYRYNFPAVYEICKKIR